MKREKLTSPGHDRVSIQKTMEWLASKGYRKICRSEFGGGRDIDAMKGNWTHYFEVKRTWKPEGWGSTVMLSELALAMRMKTRYFFILCRGNDSDPIEKWEFLMFTPTEFLKLCRLDTVLFRYDYRGPVFYQKPSLRRATWEMIRRAEEFTDQYSPLMEFLVE